MPTRPLRALLTPVVLTVALLAAVSPSSATVLEVPGNYTTIQAAINVASSGDTIVVEPGIFNEDLTITGMSDLSLVAAKAPGLVGAYSAGAFVPVPSGFPKIVGTGSGSCVTIVDSNFVSIVGFEIEQCGDFGIHVVGTGANLSQDIEIHGNYIHDTILDGVLLQQVYRTRVTSNWIENTDNGITMLAKGCLIADNQLDGAATYGIWMLNNSGVNRVIGNLVGTSGQAGILDDGQNNRIERNTVPANMAVNIEIGFTSAGSDVIGNRIFGIPIVNNGGADLAENF